MKHLPPFARGRRTLLLAALAAAGLRAHATAAPTAQAATPARAPAPMPVPGVEAGTLHLAAVVTPGVDEARRGAWLATLRALVTQHNSSSDSVLRPGAAGLAAPDRAWQLHLWALEGPATGWAAQLEALWRKQPVLAVAAGLGTQWQPVDAFCTRQKLPCWLPSVDLMPEQPGPFSIYYQPGVKLEAAVLARHLREMPPARRPQRLVQVYRNDALGHAAATALAEALANSGIVVDFRAVATATPQAVDAAITNEPAGTAWMLWLRRADLERLGALQAPQGGVWVSGRLAGQLAAVPTGWRASAQVVYPWALPRDGKADGSGFAAWAASRGVELVDEGMQAEAHFGLELFGEATLQLGRALQPAALLAKGRSLLAAGASRQQALATAIVSPARAASSAEDVAPASVRRHTAIGRASNLRLLHAHAHERGELPTPYPQLALEAGQPAASHGAFIVGFDAKQPERVEARSGWILAPTRR